MSEVVQPRRLHPIIPLVSMIRQLPEMLVPAVGVTAIAQSEGFGRVLMVLGGLLAVLLAYQILAWWRFTYTLLPNEMYIESGVFTRNRRSIPWDRVQDVEIERGPLARLLGLAKVKLETGGSESDEGLLDSIALADALALRDEIRARRGMAQASHAREASAKSELFRMTSYRILQAGLLHFSLVWLAVIAGIFQYFDELLPWSQDDVEKWIGLREQEIWGAVGPLTILLALTLLILLSTIAGVVQMFLRNYGFTLWLERRTLRRVRGLLTRSEIAIPLHRIQAVRVSAGWPKRRLDLCEVDVQTMGGASSGGMQDLAPLASSSEADQLLAIAGNFKRIAPEQFKPVAPAHRWYDAETKALPLAAISLAAGFLFPPLWWGLPIAGMLGTVQLIGARPHGWCLEGNTLHVRQGWFSQHLWQLPLANIHSISLIIGPLQRRLNLATIAIDSAGGQSEGLRIRNLPTNEARALVDLLRAERRTPRVVL